jgi:hypothetical protein
VVDVGDDGDVAPEGIGNLRRGRTRRRHPPSIRCRGPKSEVRGPKNHETDVGPRSSVLGPRTSAAAAQTRSTVKAACAS